MLGWLRNHPFITAAGAAAYVVVDWFARPIITLNIENWAASEGADKLFANPFVVGVINTVVSVFNDYIMPNAPAFALGIAICALVFGFQDWRSRIASKTLLTKVRPYVKHVAGRLKYANEVCSGEKDAERFYKKFDLQRVDMSKLVETDTAHLSGPQRGALEAISIAYSELERMVDYGAANTANLGYQHIAHLYKQRAQKLARSLNHLVTELSDGAPAEADLVPDAPPLPSWRHEPDNIMPSLEYRLDFNHHRPGQHGEPWITVRLKFRTSQIVRNANPYLYCARRYENGGWSEDKLSGMRTILGWPGSGDRFDARTIHDQEFITLLDYDVTTRVLSFVTLEPRRIPRSIKPFLTDVEVGKYQLSVGVASESGVLKDTFILDWFGDIQSMSLERAPAEVSPTQSQPTDILSL